MAEIKIRINDEGIIEALDKIVSDENYESRNQLITHILTLYCTAKNRFVCNSLPTIVNSMCQEAMAKTTDLSQKTLETFVPLVADIQTKLEEISTVLGIDK